MRQIARVGHTGTSARCLAQSFIESTSIRRERRQWPGRAACASLCRLCVRGLASLSCLVLTQLGRRAARRPALPVLMLAPSALRKFQSTGWQPRPFEAAGETPRTKEAWRAVGLPDANPRTLGGQLAVHRRSNGWLDVHRAE